MPVYFISDIHLDERNTQIADQFFYFLKNYAKNAAALYILGDLFEAWLGDDDHTPFHKKVIAALAEVTAQAVPVFFIHGNRDFFIGKKFAKATGMQLLDEHSVVEYYGKKLLLMHGDTLCTDDVAYQKVRKKLRHPLFKRLWLCTPLTFRKSLVEEWHKKSKLHQSNTALELLDAHESAIQKVFIDYPVDYLIHGHTHRPSIQLYYDDVRAKIYQRFVLSDWHTTGNYLQLDAVHGFRLVYLGMPSLKPIHEDE